MQKYIIQKANKIGALYLWWFIPVFAFVVFDLHTPFLPEEVRTVLARYPYQWDYELMFVALFVVWGAFLWIDGRLSTFSGYAFVLQGMVMIALGIMRTTETIHLFVDSVPWFILGYLLLRQGQSEK